MADDKWKTKDDVWDQGADDGWANMIADISKAGVLSPSGIPTRNLELIRNETGDI